jgi:hypothetical protein
MRVLRRSALTTCFALSLTMYAAPSPEAVIRSDWEHQEITLNRTPDEAIRAAIVRGRALAEDMKKVGAGREAERCLQQLAAAEEELKGTPAAAVAATTTDDGWHLIRAAICGVGAPLDSGRVRGKDYISAAPPVWKTTRFPALLTTVSWDETEVVYRFTGLDPAAAYRIRAIYGVNGARTLRMETEGQKLHEVEMPDNIAVEETSPIPASAIRDRALEVRIVKVSGANSIVSALELWSSVAQADPAALRRLETCRRITSPSSADCRLYFRVRQAIRDLMFAHPALDFDELLFVKRHWPWFGHQCGHRVGEAQTPGADLSILKGLRPDGQVRGLLPPDLAATCGIGRPDLSFDGKRVVFPLAKPRTPPTRYPVNDGHRFYDPAHPADSTHYRGGTCLMYDIYQIGVDGSGLRQLTDAPDSEDTEPCYLPDGRIVFTSSRDGRMVQCGDWALVFGLYTMNADGSDVRSFTQPQDSEFYPSVLDDGRILFTRWDYVMKAYNVIQQLWSVYPDGTRAQLAYGDWYAFSRGPMAMFEARQIPGTHCVVATGAAHHNTCAGPIMIADLNLNRAGPAGLRNITPEVGYPECGPAAAHCGTAWDERTDKSIPDSPLIGNGSPNATGWYAAPWPLAEDLFLCCYTYEQVDLNAKAWGIYLIDTRGNKELVYRADDASCYAPIPLKPRRVPIAMSPMPSPSDPNTPGRLFVRDVHTGLDGVPPGTVKWLRVCETYPKKRHTKPNRVDVGVGSGYDMRGVLGVVPVEADGSASFKIPPGRMIFLEVLDKDFLEVRRMRNYINLQPGESQSCIGCHETPGTATPSSARSLAAAREPSDIIPPPWGAGPMNFNRVVQPVLDRNCVRCHDAGTTNRAPFSLRGSTLVTAPHAGDADEGTQHTVSTSFLALLKHVKYVRVTGYAGPKLPLAPYAVGSAVSPLMPMLKKGHHEVKLPEADWQALAAWIDCNAPYFGSYDDDHTASAAQPSEATR